MHNSNYNNSYLFANHIYIQIIIIIVMVFNFFKFHNKYNIVVLLVKYNPKKFFYQKNINISYFS